jgi:hypothetical protein
MLAPMKRLGLAVIAALVACAPTMSAPGTGGSSSSAPTGRQSRKLEGTWSARHWLDHLEQCGAGCELRTRSLSTLGLELLPNGVARVVDDGRAHERFAASAGERSHLTEWNRTWAGSWSEGGERLQLKLEEQGSSCKRTRDDGAESDVCEALALTLQCERMRVLLAQDSPKTSWAWVCDGNVTASTGLTPLPWVFGEERVLVALDTGKNRPTVRRYMTTRRGKADGKKEFNK